MERKFQIYTPSNTIVEIFDHLNINDYSGEGWREATEEEAIKYKLSIEKIAEISWARVNAQYSILDVDGILYTAGESSKNKFFAMFNSRKEEDFPMQWRTANGSWVNLTYQQAKKLATSYEMQERNAYIRESRLIERVKQCKSLAEFDAIEISF